MSDFLKKLQQSFSSSHFLCVDVGMYGMKVIAVSKKGSTINIKNAFTITDIGKYYNGQDLFNVNGIAEQLSQFIALEKIKSKKVNLTFTSSKLQTRLVSVPDIPAKQIRSFVELEYQKQFPNFNKISDVLDYMPLGRYSKEGSTQAQLSLLLSLFPVADATRIIKEFQSKKFFVETIDVDTHALGNIGRLYNDDDSSDIAVFDIGHETSQIVFLRGETIVFSRNIPFGVNSLARALQNQEDLSAKESFEVIEEFGLMAHEEIVKGSNTIFNEDYNEIIEGSITNALNEAYRSFQTVNSNFGLSISKVLLTGGIAKLNHSKELSQKILETEVDTWQLEDGEFITLSNGTRLVNKTERTLDGTYATCIGLAVRGNFE